MKKNVLINISLASAVLLGALYFGTNNANAAQISSNSVQTQQISGGNTANDEDSSTVHIDYGLTDDNGQMLNVINNGFLTGDFAQDRRLLTGIKISAHPYAQVYRWDNGLHKTQRGLAYGSEWASYWRPDINMWQVSGNEFIRISDAYVVKP
ncbi:hypothetical protein [Companilactobacillus ginsenosidimutans]|uniref:Surface layer protein A domain-containing protein n=1 Tax=Companilactobacillus ginsenosidimutans TaxID=1007676 RepID=A0A0H4QM59_9LACO|nr:hypothetical protein [Companilactobacillus ginsenosidimutans]AKP68186.1 hypothetical protein ABM34_12010 [Companilactobacillus ginsenosidimutans]